MSNMIPNMPPKYGIQITVGSKSDKSNVNVSTKTAHTYALEEIHILPPLVVLPHDS